MDRRQFLIRSGLLGAGAALAQLPGILRARGWLDVAAAQDADLVRDTINGLVAFMVPGPDEYSVAQGESTKEPGGIEARATDAVIETLDSYLPASAIGEGDQSIPLSGAVANFLNATAAQVNPAAASGPFPSHFSRLTFAEKAAVFESIEGTVGTDPTSQNIRFVGGILPGLVAFVSYTEYGVFNPETKALDGRPVGWTLTGYQPNGPVEGWDEFRGYWKGRKRASG